MQLKLFDETFTRDKCLASRNTACDNCLNTITFFTESIARRDLICQRDSKNLDDVLTVDAMKKIEQTLPSCRKDVICIKGVSLEYAADFLMISAHFAAIAAFNKMAI